MDAGAGASAPSSKGDAAAGRPRRPFGLAYGACAAASLVVLWSVKYLPMADLPQHAAQISIWQHLRDPAYGFERQFELNWFTPYLLGYAMARALAGWLGVLAALKAVVTLAVLALPLALHRLLRRAGGDPFWSLVGFPVAFGYAFYWGFLNFLVAVPVGIFFVAEAYAYAGRPSARGGIRIASLGVFLFFCHVLVLGMALLSAFALLALRLRAVRRIAVAALPLAAPGPVVAVWLLATRQREPDASVGTIWGLGLGRFLELPGTLVGYPYDPEATGYVLILLATLAIGGLRPSRALHRWAPLAVALGLFLLGPREAMGTAFLYPRAAMVLLPFALVALEPAASPSRVRLGHVLAAVVAIAWLGILVLRFRAFDAEARPFDRIVERMEPDRRVLALTFAPGSRFVGGVPFLHFPAWYQAAKGGVLGFSFAVFYPELARYRPGAAPSMTPGLEWRPGLFRWTRDGGYDYFVVRSPVDVGPALFAGAGARLELEGQEGWWWLYGRRPR